MKNDEGEVVDLYIPRKCAWTNKLITAKDHASVQINVGHLDADGVYSGQFTTYAFSGAVRQRVRVCLFQGGRGKEEGGAGSCGEAGRERKALSRLRCESSGGDRKQAAHTSPITTTTKHNQTTQGESDSALDLLWRKKQTEA